MKNDYTKKEITSNINTKKNYCYIVINKMENENIQNPVRTIRIQRKPKQKTEEQMRQFMEKCLSVRRQKILERAQAKAEEKVNNKLKQIPPPRHETPSPYDDETIKYLTKDESSDEDEPVRYEKSDNKGDTYLSNLIIPKTRMTRASRVNFNTTNDSDNIRIYK